MIRTSLRRLPLLLVLITSTFLLSQPKSDPQAISIAQQAIRAMTQGITVQDITLTGTVTRSLGSEPETGTATLVGLGTSESRMDLLFPSGTSTEVRDASTGVPAGKWVAKDASGRFAFHNCQTDSVWFFPALGSLAAGPNVVLSYVGPEVRDEKPVQHVRSFVYSSAQLGGPDLEKLSAMDFYLDPATLLPASVTFSVHPDDDAASDIKVVIDYSNYQSVAGVVAPMRIQKYMQGTLVLDISISNVAVNSGVPPSMFVVD